MVKIDKPLVSVRWLKENFDAPNLVILDGTIPKVTADLEIANQVQIPNSRFFDIKKRFSNVDAPFPNTVPPEEQFTAESQNIGINQDSAIVVYDDKGIYSSARVWYLFKAFGHKNIAVLDGGLPEWIDNDYAVVDKQIREVDRGDFIGKYNSETFKFFDDIKVVSDDNSFQILDARSSNRFKGLEAEPRAGLRSGNIPNSESLPFKELMNRNCMKPESELREILSSFNIENKKLVFSCGSGITACILALASEITGYNNFSVYDGSWTEYGTLTDA
ncbi:sulfurtransferase [Flavobacteriaceae sp. LMIT009]